MRRACARPCSSAGARTCRGAYGATYIVPGPGRNSDTDSDAHAYEHADTDCHALTDPDADSGAASGIVFD